jgi:hypothetical protein
VRVLLLVVALTACSRSRPVIEKERAPTVAASPRTIASNQVQPWNVAVDASRVYWTNKGRQRKGEGAVYSAAKDGSALRTLAKDVSSPFGIAVANENVFYSCAVPEDPCIGDVDSVFSNQILKEPWAIAVDEETLFWTDLGTREVLAGPLTNVGAHPHFAGTHTVVAKTEGRPVGLAIDASHIYWAVDQPGTVARVRKDGGAVETLAHGDKPVGLALDATHAYWSEWGSGRIAKVPKSGGEVVVLASDQKGARAIAVDDARVYFTHAPSGTIRSVPKNGGAVFTHASGQKQPYALAIDGTTIYWADYAAGTVMAIAK